MTQDLDYPIEREMQAREESGKSKYEADARLFRPRPFKDKEKFDNKLFFLPFTFSQFAWFRNWPALRNYYLKLYVHRFNEVNDAGMPQQRYVICEPSMNNYATEQLSDPSRVVPAPFPGEKFCSFCKRSNELWEKYREQKKAAGIEGVTTERFKQMMEQHPEIKATRELAIEWSAQEKYYFLVFDYSRWLGETPREEDDEGECGIQAYIGPQALVDGLYAKQKAKNRFWDFSGNGARAIIYTRDNKSGLRYCKYTVEIEGEQPQLDGQTLAYLQSPPVEDLLDPAEFIRKFTSVEKKNYVTAYGDGSPTPRGSDSQKEPEETEEKTAEAAKPAAEIQATGRPRARVATPTTPPPTTDAPAAVAASAPAETPPPPPAQEAPPAPSAAASDQPKRAKVTWRK